MVGISKEKIITTLFSFRGIPQIVAVANFANYFVLCGYIKLKNLCNQENHFTIQGPLIFFLSCYFILSVSYKLCVYELSSSILRPHWVRAGIEFSLELLRVKITDGLCAF